MKNAIHYTQEAQKDLDEIWDYIAHELSSVSAAAETVDRIMNMIDTLADFPNIGAPLSSVADRDSGYRFLVSGSYLIFYRTGSCDVYIDRVMYGRRAYLSALFGKKLGDEENA